jgi:hypothetical protein
MKAMKQYMIGAFACVALVGATAFTSRVVAAPGGGASVPASADAYAATTLPDLVKTEQFKDKKVQFDAVVSKVGCVGCGGVTMVDKTWRISVCPEEPSKLKIPTTAGTRVRIWGVLTIVDDFREVKAHRVEKL